MGNGQIFRYDSHTLRLKAVRLSLRRFLKSALRQLLLSVALSVVLYVVLSLFISTPEEKALKAENDAYQRHYAVLRARERSLGAIVDTLRRRDDDIHRRLFHAAAPGEEPLSAVDFIAEDDSLSDSFFLSYSALKAENLQKMAEHIDSSFAQITEALANKRTIPPLSLPVKDFRPERTGASIGDRINPFYGENARHNGWDLVCRVGDGVFASADGVVKDLVHSPGGVGSMVVIDHGGGYSSRYGFLSDITVARGQKVSLGQRIGSVSVSGKSFAPHLHYEVMRDSLFLDPVNHIMASVSPEEYSEILYMSAATHQSMD